MSGIQPTPNLHVLFRTTLKSATMMTNLIFLFLCIYNLEVLTYNQMELFIEILMRSPTCIILALFINFVWPPLIEPGNARDWVDEGIDVIQSTQTQIYINMATSVRNVTHENKQLKFIVVDILDVMVR